MLKSTVITHFFNEEYLLPFWLKHHVMRFDDGILIDYKSTDSSRKIIEELAPKWKVVPASTDQFDAAKLDQFIMQLEGNIAGVKIALTVTEFLIGDPKEVSNSLVIPSIDLINMAEDAKFDEKLPFHDQRFFGYGYLESLPERPSPQGRLLHTSVANYSTGRHFDIVSGGPILIYRVTNCLVNENMIERKLQIQTKIPESDIAKNFGWQHHNWGKGLTRADVLAQQDRDRALSTNLSTVVNSALLRERVARSIAQNQEVGILDIRHLVTERDVLLSERDVLLSERDVLLSERDVLLSERDKTLAQNLQIKTSLSWRITAPVRSIAQILKKISRKI